MTADESGVINTFHAFLAKADEWEQAAFSRVMADNDSTREFWEALTAELKMLLQSFCTSRCINRISRLTTVDSPSSYGLGGGRIVECETTKDQIRITTQGRNTYPQSKAKYVFLFILEDGAWKIDTKKEISESGRERKVDLF